MKCFDSNYINTGNDFILVEADEYDRSFLNLNPNYAVITSIESDHLDIYGDYKSLSESFQLFRNNVKDVLITDAEINLDKDFSFSYKYWAIDDIPTPPIPIKKYFLLVII